MACGVATRDSADRVLSWVMNKCREVVVSDAE